MNIAIYARKSTDQSGVADDQKSVARQIEQARRFAEHKGWTVTDDHVYVDDGISGAEFAARPGFVRLMNAASMKPRPAFQALVMSEESRLGREAIETAYALKQLITAGVRVFFYLEARERTLESPTDKLLLSVTAFADELEREKARQRTYDAMSRKARSGHVTGGRVFGYDNIEVTTPGPDGRPKRSHVERRINTNEAAVVRQIFTLCARGVGRARIAAQLNAEGAPCPRAQQGRPAGWATSSIREVLYRDLYRGVIVWNKTKKRDKWGHHKPSDRPTDTWLRVEAPDLRIVSDDAWQAAHDRMAESRKIYLRNTDGRLWGRPTLNGIEAKYLLTGMARCWKCGGTLEARSRAHGRKRAWFYTCATSRRRGLSVCDNREWIPMDAADYAVLETLEDALMRPEVVTRAIGYALEAMQPTPELEQRREAMRARIATLDGEIGRFTAAIGAGADLASVVEALKAREHERDQCRRNLEALEQVRPFDAKRRDAVEAEIHRRLAEWKGLLRRNVAQARQILRKLIVGRVSLVPEVRGMREGYRLTGEGTAERLFSGLIPLAQGVASPTGLEPVFQP